MFQETLFIGIGSHVIVNVHIFALYYFCVIGVSQISAKITSCKVSNSGNSNSSQHENILFVKFKKIHSSIFAVLRETVNLKQKY